MFSRKNTLLIVSILFVLAMLAGPVLAGAGATTLVSETGNSQIAALPSISADGRYVVYSSTSSLLVVNDTNNKKDIFVRDLMDNSTTRVSVATGGTEANNDSDFGSISADGRFVAFQSNATNLVAGDTNTFADIFVHDLLEGTTTRVSVNSSGAQANNYCYRPSISPNGRYVAFSSPASNLVTDKTTTFEDIFVRDLLVGTTKRVSLANDGTQANYNSNSPSISADGRFVAFVSTSTNLVIPIQDTNYGPDIFVRDLKDNKTTRVSVASDGSQQIGDQVGTYNMAIPPSISYDGRYVAFYSKATNLDIGDTNTYSDIFVHDCQSGATTLVSVALGDDPSADSASISPSISADGRFVAFQSGASNLVAGDTNGYGIDDIFVRDRLLNSTTRVSVGSDGAQTDGTSVSPSISADGNTIAFSSVDYNHLAAITDRGNWHVFVHETSDTPVCNTLTLHSTGSGTTPSASPSKSEGCSLGQYTVGSTITLTAHPGEGNTVGSWEGTNNNSSTSTANTAIMPAGNLTVTANYVVPSAPVLTSLNPKAALVGRTSFVLTVNGTGFVDGDVVYWKNVARSTTYINPTQLTAQINAADVASTGSAAITVHPSAGELSNALTFKIVNQLVAPVLSNPTTGWITTDVTPTFTWKTVVNAVKFRIQIDTVNTFIHPVRDVKLGNGVVTYTPAALSVKKFYWRVAGIDQYGLLGKWSTIRNFSIIPLAPKLSSPANGSSTTDKTPTFKWVASKGATMYQLMVDDSTTFSAPVFSSSTLTTTSKTLTTPLTPKKYYWRVRARDAAGNWSAWSAVWTITIK